MLQIERGGALLILYFFKQIGGGAYGVGAHGGVANGVGTHGNWGRRSEGGVVAGTVAVE